MRRPSSPTCDVAASRLASARTHTIGVIVSSLTNGVFADYLRALHDTLLPAGFQVVVFSSRYSLTEEENVIATLIGQHPEAIIIAGIDQTPHARRLLTSGCGVQTSNHRRPIDINVAVAAPGRYEATLHEEAVIARSATSRRASMPGPCAHWRLQPCEDERVPTTAWLPPAAAVSSAGASCRTIMDSRSNWRRVMLRRQPGARRAVRMPAPRHRGAGNGFDRGFNDWSRRLCSPR